MVRFVRFLDPAGGYGYRVIDQVGENPIADQDPTRLSTKAEELEAAANSGHSGTEQSKAFIEPEQLSYPLAYERIAQLFDSPNAPDIVISPKSYAFGRQPGQHGALDVVQSRAPLVFSGPGVIVGRNGRHLLARGRDADAREAARPAAHRRHGLQRPDLNRARRRPGCLS